MNKKILIFLGIGIVVVILGLAGFWLMLGGGHHRDAGKEALAKEEKKDKEEAALTSTMDLFQLTLPCQRDAQGDTPIVHADFQLVVPVKHRMKVEENASRIRDIIATILRNSDIQAINNDNLVKFKQDIIKQAHDTLGVDIQEILVLRFDYDIMKQRH